MTALQQRNLCVVVASRPVAAGQDFRLKDNFAAEAATGDALSKCHAGVIAGVGELLQGTPN